MSKREKLPEKKVKILETIAILVVIAFAIVSYVVSNFVLKNDINNIVVYVDGKEINEIDGKRIDINKDMTFTIGDKSADFNVIEIKDKRISCVDANCPDKICVSHGVLRDDIDNDMIVCAPHRIMIFYK